MVALHLWSGAAVVSCAVGAMASAHPLQGPYRDTDRVLATRPPHPEGGVDDVRRPGNNGMLWISRGYIGDPDGRYPREYPQDWGSPGPAAYGAAEDDASEVHVRVDQVAVAINPWESIPEAGYQHLERGREAWLKERGFTGGVRTFTNPVFRREAQPVATASAQSRKLPEPRATFELPPDMPRFKKRQEVRAEPVRPEGQAHTIVVVRTKNDPPAVPAIDDKARLQVVVKDASAKKDPSLAVADASSVQTKPGS